MSPDLNIIRSGIGFEAQLYPLAMAAKIWETLRTLRLCRTRMTASTSRANLAALPQEVYNIIEGYCACDALDYHKTRPPFDFGRACCEANASRLQESLTYCSALALFLYDTAALFPPHTMDEARILFAGTPESAVARLAHEQRHESDEACLAIAGTLKFWLQVASVDSRVWPGHPYDYMNLLVSTMSNIDVLLDDFGLARFQCQHCFSDRWQDSRDFRATILFKAGRSIARPAAQVNEDSSTILQDLEAHLARVLWFLHRAKLEEAPAKAMPFTLGEDLPKRESLIMIEDCGCKDDDSDDDDEGETFHVIIG